MMTTPGSLPPGVGPTGGPPGDTRGRGVLLLTVVLLLGLASGGALTLLGARFVGGPGPAPPPDGPPHLRRLVHELGLDGDQADRIRAIMQRTHRQVGELVEESRLEIRELLTDEQRDRFDRMARHHRRFGPRGMGRHRRGPHHPPHGPPPPDPPIE